MMLAFCQDSCILLSRFVEAKCLLPWVTKEQRSVGKQKADEFQPELATFNWVSVGRVGIKNQSLDKVPIGSMYGIFVTFTI